jgi:alkaline phosphatase
MIRFLILFFALDLVACANNEKPLAEPSSYKTKNVVIVVVDGPRYTETWGSADHALVPHMQNDLLKNGIINTSFYNTGYTYTNSGHSAITTGVKQPIDNGGNELPKNPSMFQLWLEASGNPRTKAWIVTSKDKLEILADTKNKNYAGKFIASTNCGENGNGSGYRADSTTFRIAKQVLSQEKPNLLLVNLKDPDANGHANNWKGYLAGIKNSDEYVYQLWQFIQNDPNYRDQTTFIVTNDHGRHLNGHADGFVSHGDNCDGCRHINFFASGPDFKKNALIHTEYNQTDIPATVAELLGFNMPAGEGQVMRELFEKK